MGYFQLYLMTAVTSVVWRRCKPWTTTHPLHWGWHCCLGAMLVQELVLVQEVDDVAA